MSAHYGAQVTDVPGFALDWYATLYDGDMRTAWARMDDNFRLCMTQHLFTQQGHAGESLDPRAVALADLLAQRHPTSRHTDSFLAKVRWELVTLVALRRSPKEFEPIEFMQAGGALLEVVRLVLREDMIETGDGYVVSDGGARALSVLVSVAGSDPASWEVAGLAYLLEPGWPPKIGWQPPAEMT